MTASSQGCTNLEVRRLDRALTRHYDRYLSRAGLRNTQYALLSAVLRLGPIRPSDLAGRLQMDRSTLTRNLQPLVAQGWLHIGPGKDGRTRLVEITDEGTAARTEARELWKQAQQTLGELLGPERVTEIHRLVGESLTLMEAADTRKKE